MGTQGKDESINLTVAKFSQKKRPIRASLATSDIFRSQYTSDYDKKREDEKKAVHAEIKRTSDMLPSV